jgi:hypothetical protein
MLALNIVTRPFADLRRSTTPRAHRWFSAARETPVALFGPNEPPSAWCRCWPRCALPVFHHLAAVACRSEAVIALALFALSALAYYATEAKQYWSMCSLPSFSPVAALRADETAGNSRTATLAVLGAAGSGFPILRRSSRPAAARISSGGARRAHPATLRFARERGVAAQLRCRRLSLQDLAANRFRWGIGTSGFPPPVSLTRWQVSTLARTC